MLPGVGNDNLLQYSCLEDFMDRGAQRIQSRGWQRESNIETCILPYAKHMASAGLMHEAGHSKTVLRDNPEGWGGERRGGSFRMGGHMYTRG